MVSIYYSNYKLYVETHTESVIEYCNTRATKLSTAKINVLIQKYFSSILIDFEELVEASPETLEKLKNFFDGLSSKKKEEIKKEFSLITLYNYFTKSGFYNSIKNFYYNSEYLADKLDIFSCPYCNENFTYSFRYKPGINPVRRTFDWDHIYPKDAYPFLAISFFNLIPCCKVCNTIKGEKNLDFLNLHRNVNVNDLYFFLLHPTGAGFISDSSKLNLNLVLIKNKLQSQTRETIVTIGLLDRYRFHKEIIKDILNKQRMYPLSYITALNNQMNMKNKPLPSQFRATLYGANFSHNNYFKRPFSKLTVDILKLSKP